MSEDEALIIEKNSTEIRFDKKIVNKSGEGFLLTTNFYKRANKAAILDPNNQKPEGKAVADLEGTTVNKKK